MPTRMIKWIVPKIVFMTAAIALIFMARGYQIDLQQRKIIRTGILDLRSQPKGASIMLDSLQEGLTPRSIGSLKPQRYTLTLSKPGYHTWQKYVTIVPEFATQLFDILLYPAKADINPIGVITYPAGSVIFPHPDGQHFAVLTLHADADPTLLFELSSGYQIWQTTLPAPVTDASTLHFTWAPDAGTVIVQYPGQKTTANFIVNLKKQEITDLSPMLGSKIYVSNERLAVAFTDNNTVIFYADAMKQLASIDVTKKSITTISQLSIPLIPLLANKPNILSSTQLIGIISDQNTPPRYQLAQMDLPGGTPKSMSPDLSFATIPLIYFSPDQSSAFIEDGTRDLIVTDLFTNAPVVVTLKDADAKPFGWSPNGDFFIMLTQQNQLIYFDQLSSQTTYAYQIDARLNLESLCWHPNNATVYLKTQTRDTQKHQLLAVELDGKNPTVLLDEGATETQTIASLDTDAPILCPDRKNLLFFAPAIGTTQDHLFGLALPQ